MMSWQQFSSTRGALLMAALLTGISSLDPAGAAPLDQPACEELQRRLDALRTAGAAADMARGPEWARANLTPERLQRIGALLDVEEQLNFRCGLAKARIDLPMTIEGGEEEIPAPGEATVEGLGRTMPLPQRAPSSTRAPAAAALPRPKPASKPGAAKPPARAAAPRSATGTKGPAEGGQPKRVPRKKAPAAKKRPQADDAYRPPPRPLASDGTWAPIVRQ